MNNELKIKPLLKYELMYPEYDNDGKRQERIITFTADEMSYENDSTLKFYRTGNLIRLVLNRPSEVIITPVDA